MVKGWKIISSTKRLGGGPPMKEYFLVAVSEVEDALLLLRDRKHLEDAELSVAGEATADYLDWLDVKDGEILSVLAIS